MMTIILGRTEAEAKAKYADYRRHIAPEGALALMSGWMGIDFSGYDLDQQVRHVQNDAGRTALDNVTRADPDRVWTVREVVEHVGIGGAGPVVVGTPEKVADDIEAWFEQTDVDGLNVAFATSPGDFEDIADMLVPELTKRGRYKSEYAKGTLREKLFGAGRARLTEAASGGKLSREATRCGGGVTCRVGKGALRAVPTTHPHRYPGWWARFALPTLRFRNDGLNQFTELLTTTSISFAPGRLKADDNTDFNCEGSVTRVASSPSDFATPVKSTGGSMKSMPT